MIFIRDCIHFACSDLKYRIGRTSMNVLSIAIGVALVVTLLSIATGTSEYILAQLEAFSSIRHIEIQSMGYQDPELEDIAILDDTQGVEGIVNPYVKKPIDMKLVTELSTDSRVEEIIIKHQDLISEIRIDGVSTPLLEMPVVYYVGDQYLQSEKEGIALEQGFEPEYIKYGAEFEIGQKLAVIIPETIARYSLGIEDTESIVGKELSFVIKQSLAEKSPSLTLPVTVVGIADELFFQPSIIVTGDVMEQIKAFKLGSSVTLEQMVDSVELTVKSISDVPVVTREIQEVYGYQVQSVASVATLIEQSSLALELGILLLGAIIIFIASTNIINAMIMAVHEQTRKIGMMRATGVSRGQIQGIFLIESILIGTIGSVVGVAIAYAVISVIQHVVLSIVAMYPIMNAEAIQACVSLDIGMAWTSVLMAIVLSGIAGFYPSVIASRLAPIHAIRNSA